MQPQRSLSHSNSASIITSPYLGNRISGYMCMLIGLCITAAVLFPDRVAAQELDAAGTTDFYFHVALATFLVLFAGLMSGLTIGLLSIDTLNLRIVINEGQQPVAEYATRVLALVSHHHLLLVTLLVANSAAMEALPLVLDRIVSPAVALVLSVTAVLVFAEVVPQALCTRWGLSIGAHMAWLVWSLMFILFPISYPIAKLLDWLIGHDSGTFFRRSELKELVQIHAEGEGPLGLREVKMMRGVLQLGDNTVRKVMTPMHETFMLRLNTPLDRRLVKAVMRRGFSRVPIFRGNNPNDVVGICLVKRLLPYYCNQPRGARLTLADVDLRVAVSVSESLTLNQALQVFLNAKTHMALVVADTKELSVIGVVTMEDIMEELLSMEIFDETDVYSHNLNDPEILRVLAKKAPRPRHIKTQATSPRQQHHDVSSQAGVPFNGSPSVHGRSRSFSDQQSNGQTVDDHAISSNIPSHRVVVGMPTPTPSRRNVFEYARKGLLLPHERPTHSLDDLSTVFTPPSSLPGHPLQMNMNSFQQDSSSSRRSHGADHDDEDADDIFGAAGYYGDDHIVSSDAKTSKPTILRRPYQLSPVGYDHDDSMSDEDDALLHPETIPLESEIIQIATDRMVAAATASHGSHNTNTIDGPDSDEHQPLLSNNASKSGNQGYGVY
jgi:metal transporter CNNM